MPISCSGYDTSSRPLDTPRVSTGVHDTVMNAWGAILWRAWSGSTGIVSPGSGYDALLPRVGSSSFVVDRRPAAPAAPPRGAVSFRKATMSSFAERIQELQAALSLNKSQIARVLRVTRPTLYDWLQGREPNAANAERLRTLLRMLARAGVSGWQGLVSTERIDVELAKSEFSRNVFLNCPLDKEYEPVLQAVLFCLVRLGLKPRIATERSDAGEARISKIIELIKSSRYSIHDLSRCQARRAGERYRLNMPFELGMDFGCRHYGAHPLSTKVILISRNGAIATRRRYRTGAALLRRGFSPYSWALLPADASLQWPFRGGHQAGQRVPASFRQPAEPRHGAEHLRSSPTGALPSGHSRGVLVRCRGKGGRPAMAVTTGFQGRTFDVPRTGVPCIDPPRRAPCAAADAVFADAKAFLSSSEARQMSESELERELHRRGQELVRKLLQGHRDQRSPKEAAGPAEDTSGVECSEPREHESHAETASGTMQVVGLGCARRGHDGLHRLDAALNLLPERYWVEMRRRVTIATASRAPPRTPWKPPWYSTSSTWQRRRGVRCSSPAHRRACRHLVRDPMGDDRRSAAAGSRSLDAY